MGLFDTVHFESPEKFAQMINLGDLTVPPQAISFIKESNFFKTCDLDCAMSNYLISVEGNLKSQYFEEYEYVGHDEVTKKMAINKRGEDWMDENFQGSILITPCDYLGVVDKNLDIVFKLVFSNGFLQNVSCIHYLPKELSKKKVSKFKKIIKFITNLFSFIK